MRKKKWILNFFFISHTHTWRSNSKSHPKMSETVPLNYNAFDMHIKSWRTRFILFQGTSVPTSSFGIFSRSKIYESSDSKKKWNTIESQESGLIHYDLQKQFRYVLIWDHALTKFPSSCKYVHQLKNGIDFLFPKI